jgi:hypothetical protein
MTGLRSSLAASLWLVVSIFVVIVLALVSDAPVELVFAALVVGMLAAIAEWRANDRNDRKEP